MHIALTKSFKICTNYFNDLKDDPDKLIIRYVNKELENFTEKFDINILNEYTINSYDESVKMNDIEYRDVYYYNDKKKTVTSESEYLELMKTIIHLGKKRLDRTGVGTISVFSHQMRFNIAHTVPFLTTKFVPWKSVIKELLWFIRGETDSKILEKQGVNIWKDNSTREFLDKRGLKTYEEGDIGPMYGYQWRHYGYEYNGCGEDYNNKGYDQIMELMHNLIAEPYSRRHMITTFNPSSVKDSVLAPCHGIVCQFYVEDDDDENNDVRHLSCHVYNRSQDTFLGVPFNIASYTVLTYIIAKLCDMKPKELIVSTGDTHIYTTHIKQVQEQLTRKPLAQPVLVVSDDIKMKDLNDITVDDFELIGYIHHPTIKAPMAI